jgi:Holliday junction DNA helicase RuvB
VSEKGEAIVETEEGTMPVSPMTAELIACGADHFDPLVPDKGATREIPEPLRRKVMARDDCRCRCCGSRHGLQIHHIIPWSMSGPTEEWNLIVLCRRCHALVHAGLLMVEGKAADAHFVNRHGDDVRRSGAPPDLHQKLDLPECVCKDEDAIVSLESLPAELDHAWWRRHAHLVRFNERRGSFELSPGQACEEPETQNENGTMCRAPRLDDLIGQRRTIEALRVAAVAAGKRGKPIGHTLLTGPAGLGKTTLAKALAAEMGVRLHATSGPLLKSPLDLVALLTDLNAGDVLFIDEVHSLPRPIAEVLYEAMADQRLSLTLATGSKVRTVPLSLEPFTLVAATTEPGKLPQPLVSRFRHRQHLTPYGEADLAELARRDSDLEITDDAADRIAAVSRGTPRETLRVLDHAHDEALAADAKTIGVEHVKCALARLGIDGNGLTSIDRTCLGALRSRGGRALSLRSLAALAGLDAEAFQRDHEPYLLRLGLVGTTPRGRVALG